jgi:ankyrin repeat protein
MRNVLALLMICAMLIVSMPSYADDEAANSPHVVTNVWGGCYAKSVPSKPSGQEGITKVYTVTAEQDTLSVTLPWYSKSLYVECNVCNEKGSCGISTVRLGEWNRGHEINDHDLAIALYLNDKLLKSYSTKDIAGTQANASTSVSHYTVIKNIIGFKRTQTGSDKFLIETYDNRTLSFSATTGEITSTPTNTPAQSALFAAIEANDITKTTEILTHGATPQDINDANHDEYGTYFGQTPLHVAMSQSPEMVRLLVEHGADVNARNAQGETPLHMPNADSARASILLEFGANPEIKGGNEKESPLHKAAYNGDVESIALLLQHGATIQSPDTYGNTPLHEAASGYNGYKSIELLIKNGALPNAKNNFWQTPLHYAVQYSTAQTVATLLKAGADASIKDTYGKTARDYAIARKDEEMKKLLSYSN